MSFQTGEMENTEVGVIRSIGRIRSILEIIAAFFLFLVAATLVSLYALNTPSLSDHVVLLGALSMFAGVAVASVFLAVQKIGWDRLGFRPPKNWISTILIAVATTLFITVGVFGMLAPWIQSLGFAPVDTSLLRDAVEGDITAYILWMVLVVWGSAAFGEELFVRGFIMNRFESVFRGIPAPWLFAALAQAALFGSLHAYQGPVGVIVTGVTGFVFALVYYATGRNLWAPIIAHGLIDTVAITALYLGLL